MERLDVVIIGAGQAGLSVAYFLRRTQRSFILIDGESGPGAAWRHGWPSLRLFSPANWSSLAGWPMSPNGDVFPSARDVVAYFSEYEQRYHLQVHRPHTVTSIQWVEAGSFVVSAGDLNFSTRAVVSATGTWSRPFTPSYPDAHLFRGIQVHSGRYPGPSEFVGKRVLVVGGGNSGAQIHAELSKVARSTWVTPQEPTFLADDVDGRVLFQWATERWLAQQSGRESTSPPGGLGDIVMVPPVKDARDRGVLATVRPFTKFTPDGVEWPDGSCTPVDAVIWCTGFRPALGHLAPLGVIERDGRVAVEGTRSIKCPGLWLVGYGDWTGMASATLVGVMRSARSTAQEIDAYLPGRQ